MHICFVYPGFPPEEHAGGIGTYIYEMTNIISSFGIKVTVISRSINKKSKYEKIGTIDLYRIGSGYGRKFETGGHLKIYKKVLELIKKIDSENTITTIEACDWGGEAFFLTDIFLDRLIVRCHTPSFVSELYNPSNKPYLSQAIKRSEKSVLQKVRRIISPSQCLISEIKKHISITAEEVVEPYLISVADIKIKKKYSINNKIKVLTVGRVEERKGQDIVLATIEKLYKKGVGVEYYIVGSDTPSGNKYESMFNFFLSKLDNKIFKNIHFLGVLDRKKILEGYRDYDIYINASRFDNYPFTVLEAMAAGLPIIANNNSGMKEQIEDGFNGVLFNGTSNDLSKKIMELLNSEDERIRLGRNAINTIIKKHSPKYIKKNINNLLFN